MFYTKSLARRVPVPVVLIAYVAVATAPVFVSAQEAPQTNSATGKQIALRAGDEARPVPADAPLIAANAAALPKGAPESAIAAKVPRSQNVTINLINRLVERGVLTKDDSAELIRQAEEDAVVATAEAAARTAPAPAPSADGALMPPIEPAPLTSAERLASNSTAAAPPADDEIRVPYIPETVKAQLREDIKADVMKTARDEHWANPRTTPDWVPRFRINGDVRVRYEGDYFASGNDNTGAFPNFNAINTGAPFDISGTQFSPQLNVDKNRDRLRLRVRAGAEVDLGGGFSAGLRIATGENNSPVTTNQSLGLANGGQGGNFSKYAIWLDRGFLKYETDAGDGHLAVSAGRFDNPFFSTDIVWDDDIGFDGGLVQAKYKLPKGVTPFFAAGAFPVFNTDFNFASNQPSKFASTDRWLYAVQAGNDWKISKDFSVKLAVAYYHFDDVRGRLSAPFAPLTSADSGNTDDTRPSFAQKGNTYRPLRNIVPNATNNFGTTNQFQYFGLASSFRDLAITGRVDYNRFEPVRVSLIGEYVKNLAFDASGIERVAINNRGANTAKGATGPFVGGDTGFIVNLKAGSAALEKFGDWNASIGYRYVETDAVVDGFTDSDFGLGGTNLQGYTIGGSFALGERVWLALRWLSANSIAGPTYKNDIFQFDVNGRF